MYIDISCHSRTTNDNEVREALFKGIQKNVNGIALLPNFLLSTKDFIVEGMDLSCLIDYPYGASDLAVRSHATLSAIRKGATTIDLVANTGLYFNSKSGKFFEDIEAIYNLCEEHNILLRVMLEYRLFEPDRLINLVNSIREIGIEYVIPSTGSHLDSWEDNLLTSVELTQKASVNVITNGVIINKKQLAIVKESKVFGLRFSSISLFDTLFGV